MKDDGPIVAGRSLCEPLSDDQLKTFLCGWLADGCPPDAIEGLERRVRKLRTDWRGARLFERVTVRINGGDALRLFLKYRCSSPDPNALMAPMDREARVYRELLQPASLGTPRFYGAHMIEPDGRTLVLLEYFEGRKLKKEQEQETWLAVVKWLARMHQYFLARQDRLKSSLFLPRHDAEFYFKWACRATESASSVSAKLCASMKRLLSRYDKVAGPLGSTATLVHGEFYSTNVMVSGDAQHLRICAFDWETAAIGCGALDLTYLFRQRCGIEEPRLIRAYLEGLREAGGSPVSLSELQSQILRARIHELMCRIWSGVHYRHAPAQKIEKYSDRASLFIESL